MKNKKNGWGLRVELLFIAMFVVCILIAYIGLKSFGLIGGDKNESGTNTDNTDKSGFDYRQLELKAANAGKQYYLNNPQNMTGDEFIVSVTTLKGGGYLSSLTDGNNKECNGYVKLLKTGNQVAYISCPDYKTEGYNKDNE